MINLSKLNQFVLVFSRVFSVQDILLAQRFTAYYTKIDDDYNVLAMVEDKLFGKYAVR